MDWLNEEWITKTTKAYVEWERTPAAFAKGLTSYDDIVEFAARAAVRKALQAVDGLVIGDCMQSDNNGPFYVRVDAEGLEALKQEVGL